MSLSQITNNPIYVKPPVIWDQYQHHACSESTL